MALHFTCPHCSAKQSAPSEAAGTVHTCTSCGETFNLGKPSAPARRTVEPEQDFDSPPKRLRDRAPEPIRKRRRDYDEDEDDASGFRCPFCRSTRRPIYRSEMSQAGLIVMIVMIFFCLPLFWIGLLMKDEGEYCATCNRKVS